MVNKSKSKSDVAAAELREKLVKLEAQQSEMAKITASIVGTFTVELAKVHREIRQNHEAVISAYNLLVGEIRKLQSWSPASRLDIPAAPIAAPEPAPKTNGEKHLNTLPWLTGEQIPPEGNHSITFLGNVREWTNAKNQKRITGDFDFNGNKFSYTMAPELYEVVVDRAQKQKPISVKREIYKDNPCVRFVWN